MKNARKKVHQELKLCLQFTPSIFIGCGALSSSKLMEILVFVQLFVQTTILVIIFFYWRLTMHSGITC